MQGIGLSQPIQPCHEPGLDAWIDKRSIVGRMAYALLCIESAISAWSAQSGKLQDAVDTLWEFTGSSALDVWDREVQRVMPGVAGFYGGQREESEWRDGAEYFGFEELPDYQQDALNWMLANALAIGLDNLYAGFESGRTARPLTQVINTLQLCGLPLPPQDKVSLCRVEEDGGWGVPHPREYFL